MGEQGNLDRDGTIEGRWEELKCASRLFQEEGFKGVLEVLWDKQGRGTRFLEAKGDPGVPREFQRRFRGIHKG